MDEELIKTKNIEEIVRKGTQIYNDLKPTFEPTENGKFLAIDVESKETFLGMSSSDAVELARKAHPNTVFFLVKIGYSVAETLAEMATYKL